MKPFGFRNSNNVNDKKAIKFINDNLKNRLIDDKNVNITITEIECNQPNCAPIEVLIILLTDNDKWAGKILKPLQEVTINDVNDLEIPSEWLKVPKWIKDYSNDILDKLNNLSPIEYSNSIMYLQNIFNNGKQNEDNKTMKMKASSNNDDNNDNDKDDDNKLDNHNNNVKDELNNKSEDKNIVTVQMISKASVQEKPILPPPIRHKIATSFLDAPIRHNKGVRPRGCPCCDPDSPDIFLNFNGNI